ncbi:MAG: diacylglycerol kinase family protein [Atopobiaceae bacterium]|jgi:diacylglycerol kinase|nr:diacylglycerol kinase family protein [Atopobiaceae bacterium]MCH4180910.1 diacylglycerol kinase family protein [Atopobiaceae bacterium]MCH4213993.1 diacylglycerol kinase family protein [Atopobiaceae bacterium]MCH4229556.1 diacylglycerol kinase family protein [Atopobiaceae bacterium]MCH4276893.1 diacylglycerol kinase family protein [Atopobiaceae bacterium]
MIPGSDRDHPTFRHSFGYAIQGFRFALHSERNIKVMLVGAIAVIIAGIILELDFVSWVIVGLCIGLVLQAELVNTAIETVVDLVSPEYHPLAGRAKDIAAAAVYVLCVLVGLVGVILFARVIGARFGWW